MLNHIPFGGVQVTRQISAENPTGEPGGACHFDSAHPEETLDQGAGRKVHPFLSLGPGETKVLADIAGSGCINEFFITTDHEYLSEVILRMYWDEEEMPSVEVPLGAFFANGFDSDKHAVSSEPVVALPRNAYSSYWQMPFLKRAKITLTQEGGEKIGCIAYRLLYKLFELPKDVMYFHAQYRRSMTSKENPVYTILDGVKGKGCYVGTYLAWNALNSSWWGEGEVKFYIDGDTDYPSMADNGAEDYFGGSFGFSPFNTDLAGNAEQTFSTAYLGMPLAKLDNRMGGRRYSLYRWHIHDNIGFFSDLKVTVDTLGWWRKAGLRPLGEDISSVAYWYQYEGHAAFLKLPEVGERWDR